MSLKQLENHDWLYREYITNNRSCEDIANELGSYRHCIRRALIKMQIPLRSKSAAQAAALKTQRATHPTKGNKRPESVRVSISESVAQNWSALDEAELKRRSDMARQQWEDMSQEERDNLLELALAAVLRASKEGSKMEKFLAKELTKAGYVIEYHKSGFLPSEKLQIDLFVPALSTAIEIDGPSHFLPIWGEDKLLKTIEADQKKTGLLLHLGLIIIRVKYSCKSISNKLQRDILNIILKHLESINIDYPKKTNRLIEIEV